MSSTVIKVEDIAKLYKLGEVGTGTLSHDLKRWWHKVRGKEDPYAVLGEANDRTNKRGSDYVWALKDINFDVQQGEVIGIIGRNGAGKSTLLKILSRTTSPTKGQVKIKGRVASLLEVGTGFHPELTGKENIYLNGAILGMQQKEIKRKLDEITDFAGVERYIHTPVKRYSSGMYVRLAFAVAAHLESEVLIIDEVLAVGDAEFQRKCLGKIGEVSKGSGRTVLFVSHNMSAVKQLCSRALVFKNGQLEYQSSVSNAVGYYQKIQELSSSFLHRGHFDFAPGNSGIRILKVQVNPLENDILTVSSGLEIEIHFYNAIQDINLDITFEVKTLDDIVVFHNGLIITNKQNSQKGIYIIKGEMKYGMLNAGIYKLTLLFGESQKNLLLKVDDFIQFEVLNETAGNNTSVLPGIFRPLMEYKAEFIIP